MSLIQEDSNKQTLLSQQQGDSVRYLNELNSVFTPPSVLLFLFPSSSSFLQWLEAFVNNGTSQIQGISNNIERLCNEIGCTSTSTSTPTNNNGRPSSRSPGPQPNLVNDIRQLVAGMKARDQNFAALQAAVHSLLEVLSASQAQHGAGWFHFFSKYELQIRLSVCFHPDSQAIAGLMDRQRHDQEAMFRAFTNGELTRLLLEAQNQKINEMTMDHSAFSEISGEIKGERLRFVDAMKEATAINVQRKLRLSYWIVLL